MSLFRAESQHSIDGPHQNQEIAKHGPDPEEARGGVILLHGRGASAQSILSLARELKTEGITYFAPQAADNTWYPHSFMEPRDRNEPGISSGLQAIHQVVNQFHQAGMKNKHILLMGFSQGACLTLEYAARHPHRYGGVIGLSGGVIGERIEFQHYYGSLEGTPVFLGCSQKDPHIPKQRVDETAKLFRYLDANVTKTIYPDLGHSVNEDELEHARQLINKASTAT